MRMHGDEVPEGPLQRLRGPQTLCHLSEGWKDMWIKKKIWGQMWTSACMKGEVQSTSNLNTP